MVIVTSILDIRNSTVSSSENELKKYNQLKMNQK